MACGRQREEKKKKGGVAQRRFADETGPSAAVAHDITSVRRAVVVFLTTSHSDQNSKFDKRWFSPLNKTKQNCRANHGGGPRAAGWRLSSMASFPACSPCPTSEGSTPYTGASSSSYRTFGVRCDCRAHTRGRGRRKKETKKCFDTTPSPGTKKVKPYKHSFQYTVTAR